VEVLSTTAADRAGADRSTLGSRVHVLGSVLTAGGLAAVILGSFLPWLTSGGVQRNSYAITGIMRRLGLAGGGYGATALSLWPLLGPVVMLAVTAAILRRWRLAAAIALLIALPTAVLAGAVLLVAGGRGGAGVSLAHPGPVTTGSGALFAVAGALTVLLAARSAPRRRASATHMATEPASEQPGWQSPSVAGNFSGVSMEPATAPFRLTRSEQCDHRPVQPRTVRTRGEPQHGFAPPSNVSTKDEQQ